MSQTAYSESIDLAFSQEAEPWAQDGLQIVDSLTDAFSEQFDAAAAFLASAEKAASNDVNEDTPSGYDKAEEDALLARAKDGDEAAYSTLFLKYEPSVRRLLMRFQTPEDTNDILQDVHIRGWRGLKNFREDSRFHTWIYTIARNTSIKFSNLNKKHKGCSYEDLFDSDLYDLSLEAGNNPLGFLEDEETLQAFIAALEILPDDMKKTFRLRIIEMKSCEETAAALGILEGTVKSRIFKAKKHIEKECAARGIDLQLTKTVKKPKKKAPIAKTVSADSKCGPRYPKLSHDIIVGHIWSHLEKFGTFPHKNSGEVFDKTGENWHAIDGAGKKGRRSISDGITLKQRICAAIQEEAICHVRLKGEIPKKDSGALPNHPDFDWEMVDNFLKSAKGRYKLSLEDVLTDVDFSEALEIYERHIKQEAAQMPTPDAQQRGVSTLYPWKPKIYDGLMREYQEQAAVAALALPLPDIEP